MKRETVLILMATTLLLLGCESRVESNPSEDEVDADVTESIEANVPEREISAGVTESIEADVPEREISTEGITLVEENWSDSLEGTDHLTLEEAALVGVEYISTFFDFDFDGTYMRLEHRLDTTNTILNFGGAPVWRGMVLRSDESGFETVHFPFAIHAESGDWIMLGRGDSENIIFGYSVMDIARMSREEQEELFPPLDEETSRIMLEQAETYAQMHFRESALYHIEYHSESIGWVDFRATDEHGRVIYVTLQKRTNALRAFDAGFNSRSD